MDGGISDCSPKTPAPHSERFFDNHHITPVLKHCDMLDRQKDHQGQYFSR
jgi:hypothetical protein